MGVERSEKSKLEQSFESGLHAFGLALANLKHEEYLYFLITLEDVEGTKTVYH
jgi:hypothetical protein